MGWPRFCGLVLCVLSSYTIISLSKVNVFVLVKLYSYMCACVRVVRVRARVCVWLKKCKYI